jgi:hypothetical protein
LGARQEWSYSFNIIEAEPGVFDGQPVRFLKKMEVIGVGQVTRGAGIDTHTESVKGLKPYPNEHACRLRDPDDFQDNSFRRIERTHESKKYSVIVGKLRDGSTMTEQAYRYADDVWTAAEARSHCKTHEGTFEAATGKADDHGQDPPEGDTPRSPTPSVVASRIKIEQMED